MTASGLGGLVDMRDIRMCENAQSTRVALQERGTFFRVGYQTLQTILIEWMKMVKYGVMVDTGTIKGGGESPAYLLD